MGRYGNTGISKGTLGNPQQGLANGQYANKVGKLELLSKSSKIGKQNKKDNKLALIEYLKRHHYKFTKSKIKFIVKNKFGKVLWLEKGNRNSGLEHIIARHGADFTKAFGITNSGITKYLKNVITKGTFVSKSTSIRGRHKAFAYTYRYKGKDYVLLATGENGYIVTARPKKKGKN